VELLERASFLHALTEYADEARRGDGRLVLLSGESGIGKDAGRPGRTGDRRGGAAADEGAWPDGDPSRAPRGHAVRPGRAHRPRTGGAGAAFGRPARPGDLRAGCSSPSGRCTTTSPRSWPRSASRPGRRRPARPPGWASGPDPAGSSEQVLGQQKQAEDDHRCRCRPEPAPGPPPTAASRVEVVMIQFSYASRSQPRRPPGPRRQPPRRGTASRSSGRRTGVSRQQ
jgi:hypothetical protein